MLLQLPLELQEEIISHLNYDDMIALFSTCRYFYSSPLRETLKEKLEEAGKIIALRYKLQRQSQKIISKKKVYYVFGELGIHKRGYAFNWFYLYVHLHQCWQVNDELARLFSCYSTHYPSLTRTHYRVLKENEKFTRADFGELAGRISRFTRIKSKIIQQRSASEQTYEHYFNLVATYFMRHKHFIPKVLTSTEWISLLHLTL